MRWIGWLMLGCLLASSACSTAAPAQPDKQSASRHSVQASSPDWLDPPPGSRTRLLPVGDPDALNLPDDVSAIQYTPVSPLNHQSRRKYRLYGRLPAHMGMRMASRFHAYDWRNPACQAQIATLAKPPRWGEIIYPVPVRHKGDRFEATLVIDRFDSPCQWVYQSTDLVVYRLDDTDDPGLTSMEVVIADFYHAPEGIKRCRRSASKCTEERFRSLSNASTDPVLIRCRYELSKRGSDKGSYFTCQNRETYKQQHLLKPKTRAMRIDIYDLDVDADPIQAVSPAMQGAMP